MKIKLIFFANFFFLVFASNLFAQTEKPIVSGNFIFEEKDGLVAVESEFFYKQTKSEIRQWYITSSGNLPEVLPNHDPEHISGSSNNAYIEVLPDTRVTHDDKLIPGENFSNDPGKMAVLHYKVKINNPGRYYVWVRAFSTGTEDNGLHVGFNDTWPAHGQRMQWCEGKNEWTWASKQRTEAEHCGVPKEIYLDFENAGIYDLQFSMREDGFEMDNFILTNDIHFVPEGTGPSMQVFSGKLPDAFPEVLKP